MSFPDMSVSGNIHIHLLTHIENSSFRYIIFAQLCDKQDL